MRGAPEVVYRVVPSRSHQEAWSILSIGASERRPSFETGSYDREWAIRYAEAEASFDRNRGLEVRVEVVPEALGFFSSEELPEGLLPHLRLDQRDGAIAAYRWLRSVALGISPGGQA